MAKDPVLVVLQLSGGNDYMNTVIPYANSLYWDNRPVVNIPEDKIVDLDGKVGFNPSMAPLKKFYEDGRLAVIHGVGYADSPRSHFRSMDIWHTCEPDIVGTEGWLGRALQIRSAQGKCGYGREFWSEYVPRHVIAGCASGLRQWLAGNVRHATGHPG
jgi:uncharacterized protein (DUF1501 family)